MNRTRDVEYTLEDLLEEQGAPVTAIGLGGDGELMVTGDVSRHVRIYRRGELLKTINLLSRSDKVRPTERMRSIAISPSSNRFFVSSGDTLRCFSAVGDEEWAYQPARAFGFLVTSPLGLSVNSAGDLAASFDNGSIAVWDSGGRRKAMWRDNDAPRWLGFLRDGRRVIGSDGFSIAVWDCDLRTQVGKFNPGERIYGFACDSGRDLIAIRTLREVSVYDANSGDRIAALPAGEGLPLVTFLGGQKAVAISDRSRVRIHLLDAGGIRECSFGDRLATSLTSAADGNQIAIGCSDGTVQMQDTGLSSPDPRLVTD